MKNKKGTLKILAEKKNEGEAKERTTHISVSRLVQLCGNFTNY